MITKQQFLKTVRQINGMKYKYVRIKKDELKDNDLVAVLCPLHKTFHVSVKDALAGKTECSVCKKLNFTVDNIIKFNKLIYGNYFDVKFSDGNLLVTCPLHGEFKTDVLNFFIKGFGCPKCSKQLTDRKFNYKMRKIKREKTNVAKYGKSNPMQIDSIKQKQFKNQQIGVKQNESVADFITRIYPNGIGNRLRNLIIANWTMLKKQSSLAVVKRMIAMLDKYGVVAIARTKSGFDKIKRTNKQRYGTENFMKSEAAEKVKNAIVTKGRETQLKKYGAVHFTKSKYYQEHESMFKQREYATKRLHHSFNSSKNEDIIFKRLIFVFGKDDVVRQYSSNEYPYLCDFYIKSRDMYIEYNGMWTHGNHWFDRCNSTDLQELTTWKIKAKASDFYKNAIDTWTRRDIEKRECAKRNKLNYVAFWDRNLRDLKLWLDLDCPDGKDYIVVNSWLPNFDLSKGIKKPRLTNSSLSVMRLAKYYQFRVFYEHELKLWQENPQVHNTDLRTYLLSNRMHYLHKAVRELTVSNIMSGFKISGLYHGFSSFDNTAMKYVIDKYQIKSIFDPCAGWGERMITAWQTGTDYTGVDINQKLKAGYDKLKSDLRMTKQNIVFSDSQNYQIKKQYDAIITCPPYFNLEKYSDNGIENKSYQEFLTWWEVIVKKSYKANIEYFCFQINQKYLADMKQIVLDSGYRLIGKFNLKQAKSHLNKNKKEFETMLIFKK